MNNFNIQDGIFYTVSLGLTLGTDAQGEPSDFDEVMWSADALVGEEVSIVGHGTSPERALVDLANNMRSLRDGRSSTT